MALKCFETFCEVLSHGQVFPQHMLEKVPNVQGVHDKQTKARDCTAIVGHQRPSARIKVKHHRARVNDMVM